MMKRILATFAVLLLVGCSSNKSDSSSTLTGQFDGISIEGLSYETASHSGKTTASGQFSYEPGESIQFSIGSTLIGDSIPAEDSLALHQLLPITVLPTNFGEFNTLFYQASHKAERDNFHHFNNLLTVIFSLDNDANPLNGVVIPAEVSDLMKDVEINFDQHLKTFAGKHSSRYGKGDDTLRKVTHLGTAAGWLSRGDLYAFGLGLQRYYQANDIESNFYMATEQSTYSDMNTEPDSIVSYVFDEYGNIPRKSTDNNGDGNLNNIRTATFNDNNKYLTESTDSNGDGDSNYGYLYEYDTFGNPTKQSYDSNGDGAINSINTLTFNEYGFNTRSETDSDNDGDLDAITVTTFDDRGNATSELQDNDGDGVFDSANFNSHDSNGNRIRTEYDDENDGSIDSLEVSTYDSNNNRLTQYYDSGADGDYDRLYVSTYNLDGNRLVQTRDNDGDGTVDEITTETYNDAGLQITYSRDDNADGTAESTSFYGYDAQNNLNYSGSDFDGDGIADSTNHYTLDDAGNILRIDTVQSNGNEQTLLRTYNEFGNQLTSSIDNGADGLVNTLTTYSLGLVPVRAILDTMN